MLSLEDSQIVLGAHGTRAVVILKSVCLDGLIKQISKRQLGVGEGALEYDEGTPGMYTLLF